MYMIKFGLSIDVSAVLLETSLGVSGELEEGVQGERSCISRRTRSSLPSQPYTVGRAVFKAASSWLQNPSWGCSKRGKSSVSGEEITFGSFMRTWFWASCLRITFQAYLLMPLASIVPPSGEFTPGLTWVPMSGGKNMRLMSSQGVRHSLVRQSLKVILVSSGVDTKVVHVLALLLRPPWVAAL